MARVPIVAALFIAALALAIPGHPYIERAARHFGFIAAPRPLSVGDRLGDLHVLSMNGQSTVLTPPAGRTHIINVFATWCVECKTEIPRLAQLAPELARKRVDLVGIDQQESVDQVARFTTAYNMHYPVYIDDNGMTRQILGARYIPTTIVVDPAGVIRFVRVGPLSNGDLFAMLDAARERV